MLVSNSILHRNTFYSLKECSWNHRKVILVTGSLLLLGAAPCSLAFASTVVAKIAFVAALGSIGSLMIGLSLFSSSSRVQKTMRFSPTSTILPADEPLESPSALPTRPLFSPPEKDKPVASLSPSSTASTTAQKKTHLMTKLFFLAAWIGTDYYFLDHPLRSTLSQLISMSVALTLYFQFLNWRVP